MSRRSPEIRRRRRQTGLAVFAVIILLLMIAEGIVLAFAFFSPSGSQAISRQIAGAQEVWEGTKDEPGLKDRTSTALGEFYDDQIKTLWAAPTPDPTEPTFTKCADCHPGFETQRQFSGIYMNHPAHEEAGVDCAACHTMVQHPGPTPPSEEACAECHEQVNREDGCDYCHAPGSLPHFYLLGYPRNAAVDCATCHPAGSFEQGTPERLVRPGPFDGSQKKPCMECHQYKTPDDYLTPACLDCHGSPHPEDWIDTHGSETGVFQTGSLQCTSCHSTAGWCAMQCHPYRSATPKFPQPKEVPSP